MTWNDGSYLSGIFKNGLIDGSGSYVNSNGLMMNGKVIKINKISLKKYNNKKIIDYKELNLLMNNLKHLLLKKLDYIVTNDYYY